MVSDGSAEDANWLACLSQGHCSRLRKRLGEEGEAEGGERTRRMMMMLRARHSAQTCNYGTGGMKVAMKPEGETVSHQARRGKKSPLTSSGNISHSGDRIQ